MNSYNALSMTVTYREGDGKGSVSETYSTFISNTQRDTNFDSWDRLVAGTSGNPMVLIDFVNIFGNGSYQIPYGSTINSATLTIIPKYHEGAWKEVRVYRITSAWNESTVTYNTFNNAYDTTAFYTFYDTGGESQHNIPVTSILQGASNNTYGNYGWLYKNYNPSYGVTVHSDANTTFSYRPMLTVDYSTPQWVYINNAQTPLSENWVSSEVDQLYSLYTNAQGSATIDAKEWYYTTKNYGTEGFWGSGHSIGNAWIDDYGFKHIYLNGFQGITTFDRSTQWEYIAIAGRSTVFNETWTLSEVDQLLNLYAIQTGSILIDGELWYYTLDDYSEPGSWGGAHAIGDYWVDSRGFKHIYLGAGLTTESVPEPTSIILLGCTLLGLLRKLTK